MKSVIFVIFLFLSGLVGTRAVESAADYASRLAGEPLAKVTMESIPVARRQEVIEALLAIPWTNVLLRLNHPPTVAEMIQRYTKSDGKDPRAKFAIRRSGSPWLVAAIAPMLYKTDEIKSRHYGEGDSDYGVSVAAAETVGALVSRAPEFSPAVRAWAKRNLDHAGPDIIQLGRTFWETNESALKEERFAEVVAPDAGRPGLVEEAAGDRLPEPDSADKAAPDLAVATPKPAPGIPEPEIPASSTRQRWLGALGLGALALAGFVARRLLRKRPEA